MDGCEQAARGVLPADEGLDPRAGTGAEVDLGLVEEAKLSGADRLAQFVAGLEPVEAAGADLVVEHLEAIAAAFLGAAHRRVGIAQQFVRCSRSVRHDDADAGRQEHLGVAQLKRRGEHTLDASCDRDRFGLPGELGTHDHELVAADPGDGVARPRCFGEACREAPQQRIAGVVAVDVVDGLEVIEVDVQHTDGRHAARCLGEGARETVEQQCSVGQPRELVMEREVVQLRLIGQALGHVDGECEACITAVERDRV